MLELKKIKLKDTPYQPLYRRVEETLVEYISKNGLAPGTFLPPERKLSKVFGVDRITVRRALKELEQKRMVCREQGRGTYVAEPQKTEEKIGTVKSRNITVILPYIGPDTSELLYGIEQVFNPGDFQVVLRNSYANIDREKEYLSSEIIENSLGVILYPYATSKNASHLKKFLRKDIPLVLVNDYFPDVRTDFVVLDNFDGAYKVTEHLLKHDCRNIAIIADDKARTSIEERIRGYQQALKDYGGGVNKTFIARGRKLKQVQWDILGYRLAKELVSGKQSIDAIFAVNYHLAVGAFRAVKESGLKVPEGIALVSFGIGDYTSLAEIPITTVDESWGQVGINAAKILREKIEGKGKSVQQIFVKGELEVRESSRGGSLN